MDNLEHWAGIQVLKFYLGVGFAALVLLVVAVLLVWGAVDEWRAKRRRRNRESEKSRKGSGTLGGWG